VYVCRLFDAAPEEKALKGTVSLALPTGLADRGWVNDPVFQGVLAEVDSGACSSRDVACFLRVGGAWPDLREIRVQGFGVDCWNFCKPWARSRKSVLFPAFEERCDVDDDDDASNHDDDDVDDDDADDDDA
jgi:hypothetical protein